MTRYWLGFRNACLEQMHTAGKSGSEMVMVGTVNLSTIVRVTGLDRAVELTVSVASSR